MAKSIRNAPSRSAPTSEQRPGRRPAGSTRIDSREPSKLQDALAELHGMARAGSLPIDVAAIPRRR